jgi:nucleoside-diphosphate-sugar epimerase
MSAKKGRVLVTGVTGFVGEHLCQYLLTQGWQVRAVGRQESFSVQDPALEYCQVEGIDSQTDWKDYLKGVDFVVHLASRVHRMHERGMQFLEVYQEVNVRGTRQLAKSAIAHNVKRFIYLSTIKVNGEKTIDMPFRADEQPRPEDAYSLSKLQAELILQEEARRSGMEWVIIRPTLIYGPKVKGNFRLLMNLAKTYLPLPFGSIKNKRSFISIYNLTHFIENCLSHPNASGEVFLISDDEDVSTPQLIKLLRKARSRWSGVFYFPVSLLHLFAIISLRAKLMSRLTQSLQVNIEKTKRLLNWHPPYDMLSAIKKMNEEDKA